MKRCAACGHAPAKLLRRGRWLCTTCGRIEGSPRWTWAPFRTTRGVTYFASRPGPEVIDDAVEEMARMEAAA